MFSDYGYMCTWISGFWRQVLKILKTCLHNKDLDPSFLNSWINRIQMMVFKQHTCIIISMVSPMRVTSLLWEPSSEPILYLFLISESVQSWLRKLCRQCTHGGKIIKRGKAKQIQEAGYPVYTYTSCHIQTKISRDNLIEIRTSIHFLVFNMSWLYQKSGSW